jgi:hypothetical protein
MLTKQREQLEEEVKALESEVQELVTHISVSSFFTL